MLRRDSATLTLKIKQKSLAKESSIIKREERKVKEKIKLKVGNKEKNIFLLDTISTHRRRDVRNESRATHLARTFLQDKPYKFAERKVKAEKIQLLMDIIVPKVTHMVNRYSSITVRAFTTTEIKEWIYKGNKSPSEIFKFLK